MTDKILFVKINVSIIVDFNNIFLYIDKKIHYDFIHYVFD